MKNSLKLKLRCFSLALFTVASLSNAAESKVVRLEANRCHFFALFSYTNAEFIGLLSDGEYVRIDREHMFVEQNDSGKWSQAEDGIVTLRSREHFHDVEYGPLSIFLYFDLYGTELRKIKSALSEFLQHSMKDSYSFNEVKSIGDISIDFEVEYYKKKISRANLKGLLKAMEEFDLSSDKNAFLFTPISYKDWVFLEWKNSEIPNTRDRRVIIKDLDSQKKDEFPPFHYVQISQETFEKEAGTTQPFMFYKEMNENRPDRTTEIVKITSICEQENEH